MTTVFQTIPAIAILGLQLTACPLFLAACTGRMILSAFVVLMYMTVIYEGYGVDSPFPFALPADQHDAILYLNGVYPWFILAYAFLGKMILWWFDLKPLVSLFSLLPKDVPWLNGLNNDKIRQPAITAWFMLIWVIFCACLFYIPYKIFMNKFVIDGINSPWQIVSSIYGIFIPLVFMVVPLLICLFAYWGWGWSKSFYHSRCQNRFTWLTDKFNCKVYEMMEKCSHEIHIKVFMRQIVKTILIITLATFLTHVVFVIALTFTNGQTVTVIMGCAIAWWVISIVLTILFGTIFRYYVDPWYLYNDPCIKKKKKKTDHQSEEEISEEEGEGEEGGGEEEEEEEEGEGEGKKKEGQTQKEGTESTKETSQNISYTYVVPNPSDMTGSRLRKGQGMSNIIFDS